MRRGRAHDPQTHAVPATYGREFSGVGAEIKQHPGGGPAGSAEDDLEVGRAQHGAPVAERGLGHLGRRLRIVEHVHRESRLVPGILRSIVDALASSHPAPEA